MPRTTDWTPTLHLLERAGVTLAHGLSAAELDAAERFVGAAFPPDLRELLSTALPVGRRFPDWRRLDSVDLAQQLAWPLDGMLFDIEHNDVWLAEWGARPDDLVEALAMATAHVGAAPRMIPVYGHRYLPAEPCRAGNPVFSVYQTDIIHYGRDLTSSLENEFDARTPDAIGAAIGSPSEIREIRFWSALVE